MVYIIRVFFIPNLKSTEIHVLLMISRQEKNAKDFFKQGKLGTEDEFEHFCKTVTCEKELAKKYVEHSQILEINRKKRFTLFLTLFFTLLLKIK